MEATDGRCRSNNRHKKQRQRNNKKTTGIHHDRKRHREVGTNKRRTTNIPTRQII